MSFPHPVGASPSLSSNVEMMTPLAKREGDRLESQQTKHSEQIFARLIKPLNKLIEYGLIPAQEQG